MHKTLYNISRGEQVLPLVHAWSGRAEEKGKSRPCSLAQWAFTYHITAPHRTLYVVEGGHMIGFSYKRGSSLTKQRMPTGIWFVALFHSHVNTCNATKHFPKSTNSTSGKG